MGSGDPSGLQNRRELAWLALVSSTLTRFRHLPIVYQGWRSIQRSFDSPSAGLGLAQDFGSRLERRENASSSTLTRFRHLPIVYQGWRSIQRSFDSPSASLGLAQDFGSRLERRE
jgi:hypothetical protein